MSLLPYSEEQILDRLRFENPWWVSREIEQYYSSMKYRLYYDSLFPLILDSQINRAVVLMGPRRVGKTVILHHVISRVC